LIDLVVALQDRGVEAAVACPSGSCLEARLRETGATLLPLALPALRRRMRVPAAMGACAQLGWAAVSLARFARKRGVLLIHSNTTLAQIWSGPAARLAGIPCVWHWRDFYDLRWLNRMLASSADASIAVSTSVERFARSQLGAGARIALVENGLPDTDSSAVRRAASARATRCAEQGREVRVLLLGQAEARKGHEVLIRAMQIAVARYPALQAVIASPVPDARSARYLSRLQEIAAGNVRFLEPAGEVMPLLHEADILAVPSLREPFGRVAVEGMLAGLPVVASNVDGLASIVLDGETGFLVPPGDPEGLSQAILLLAARPDLRLSMGQKGRRRALCRYHIDRVATEVLKVYESVLGPRDRA